MTIQLRSAFRALLAASLLAFGAIPAAARPSSTYRDKLDVPQDISLPMAKGELQAEIAAEQAQRERASAPRTTVEAGISSWRPEKLDGPARLSRVTPFSPNGTPALFLSLFSPVSSQLELELGLGYLSESRTGELGGYALGSRRTETAYVYSLRLGARYLPWRLMGGQLRPYLEGAVLPTLVVSTKSAFNDGIGDFGPGFELGAGALVEVWRKICLDFRAAGELGRAGASSLRGFSLASGVVVPL